MKTPLGIRVIGDKASDLHHIYISSFCFILEHEVWVQPVVKNCDGWDKYSRFINYTKL